MTQNPLSPGAKPPSPEQLAAALQTLMSALSFQPQQQAEWQLMVEAATKLDSLDLQIKKLQKEKAESAAVLIPLLHKLAAGKLTLANGNEVLACVSQERRPKKAQIVAYFVAEFGEVEGKKKAEAFWKSVPSKTREYISVRRPGETPAEDAETEESAAT